MAPNKPPFNEAGRRLKAALVSYQLRLKGVDSTLKTMPEDPGEGWAQLAENLLRGMADQVVAELGSNKSAQYGKAGEKAESIAAPGPKLVPRKVQ